jgi:hypothetical protein
MAIAGLDDYVQVKVDATISAHSQIVDAVLAPRKAALTGSIDMKVEAGALRWDRSLARKDVIHAYAVIRDARKSEIAFVYLLASHSRILSHLHFSQVFGWIADIRSNGRPSGRHAQDKLSSKRLAVPAQLAFSGRLWRGGEIRSRPPVKGALKVHRFSFSFLA